MPSVTYTSADLSNIIPLISGGPNFVQGGSGFDRSTEADQDDPGGTFPPTIGANAESSVSCLVGANIDFAAIPLTANILSIREQFAYTISIIAQTAGDGADASTGYISQGDFSLGGVLFDAFNDNAYAREDSFDEQVSQAGAVALDNSLGGGSFDETFTWVGGTSKANLETLFADTQVFFSGHAKATAGGILINNGDIFGPAAAVSNVAFSGWSITIEYEDVSDTITGILDGTELTVDVELFGAGGVEVGGDAEVTPMSFITDLSGIYTIVPGQKFDRVYTRNEDPADTTDVRIPPPFAKTGFFGG